MKTSEARNLRPGAMLDLAPPETEPTQTGDSQISIRIQLKSIVSVAEEHGLPVAFMRAVLKSNYTYSVGDNVTETTFNNLSLQKEALINPKHLIPNWENFGKAGVAALSDIYHEATHAYLDLRCEAGDSEVIMLLEAAERYYKGAEMKGGKVAVDPERIAQEAAAEYVGQRVGIWWESMLRLEAARELRDGGNSNALDLVITTRADYNRGMAVLAYGYDDGMFRGKVWTKKEIFPALKSYAATHILESKIPESFDHNRSWLQEWSYLTDREEIPGLRRLRP